MFQQLTTDKGQLTNSMILVDDQPYGQSCPAAMTVRELAHQVCADTGPENRRMVVAVYRDGRPVADADLNAVLDARIANCPDLALQTQPVAALVRSALDQALSMLEDAAVIRTTAADLLDQGRQAEAMQQIQHLLDIWRQTQQSLTFSAEALGLDLNSLEADGSRFPDLINAMKANLENLREAMRNQDPILIADLLRYELDHVFAKWDRLLREIRGSTQSC